MAKTLSDKKIATLLTRRVEEVIDRGHLEKQLAAGHKLRVKLGIDPTSPDIHIGRAVTLWKLREFQELGHQVVFIAGDFTGLIGDTSDKDAERPMLSEAQVEQNIKTYFQQAAKIIDPKKSEMYYNSKWLKKLGFLEIGRMADVFGLHEFESRENVSKRLRAGKRVSVRELLYPLMQGYDSVAVKADLEIGGTDQRFNLLAGRTIQPLYNQAPQDILTLTLMEGTDGRKMSSSWGNVIKISEAPDEMFGKVMSISDSLIKKYFVLATRMELAEIEAVMQLSNPRAQKVILAKKITELYHGPKAAAAAEENFETKFGKLGGTIKPDFTLKKKAGNYPLIEILVEGKLAASKSEARRKLLEGAVVVDDQKVSDPSSQVAVKSGTIVRLGKRFLKIV
ncbi:MAG: tyrosine--tRNA ligase [Patescibacteria group bacterium]|nr:tyrosine--tRNA ligase [Patescibacteria group bacterium]